MTADEFTIRHLTKDLHHLYTLLEERKHTPEKPKEARTMRPAPGPRAPGNHLWIARGIDMEQRLREIAFNAFHDLQIKLRDDDGKVHNILRLVTYHAQPIADLPWADDFQDELDRQARVMGKWLNPTANTTQAQNLAKLSTKRFTASEAAALASEATGLKIDRKQVTYWGRSNTKNVDVVIGKDGVATYNIGQVIDAATHNKDGRRKVDN